MELAITSVDFRMEEMAWNDLIDLVAVLQIMSNKMDYLQKPDVTMSDAYGLWLELEGSLKRLDNPFARIMLNSVLHRRSEMRIIENDVMISALFLDLRFNLLLTSNQRDTAIKHLRYMYQKLRQRRDSVLYSAPTTQTIQTQTGNETSMLEEILREMESTATYQINKAQGATNHSLDEELTKFCVKERENASVNIITAWERRKYEFPILYELAKIVLTVSPTEASVKMNFSTLEYVLSKRRTRLAEVNLDLILLLKLNDSLFYEAFENGEISFE